MLGEGGGRAAPRAQRRQRGGGRARGGRHGGLPEVLVLRPEQRADGARGARRRSVRSLQLPNTPLWLCEPMRLRRRQIACDVPYFRNTADAFVQITRKEGVRSLYNGLSPTLAMAVPATVLYFTTYDNIRLRIAQRVGPERDWLAPVLAGSTARTISTTVISPLELVRTIMMAERGRAGGTTVLRRVGAEISFAGPSVLFRGLIPSLWKDVPFSAIYWLGYEQLRKRLLMRFPGPEPGSPTPDLRTVFRTSFAAGALSGSFAAVLTCPFDVIKTRQQVFIFDRAVAVPSTAVTCAQIVGEAGWSGLFAGLGPRLLKVAPACAIMIGSYEFGKEFFRQANQLPAESQ